MTITPRIIRYRDAPGFLGMDRNRFDAEVRPGLVEIPIGERGIGFDRLDLDAWADDYKARNGRPSRKLKGIATCEQGREASTPLKMVVKQSTSITAGSGSMKGSATSVRTKPKPGSAKSKTGSMQRVNEVLSACIAMRQNNTS